MKKLFYYYVTESSIHRRSIPSIRIGSHYLVLTPYPRLIKLFHPYPKRYLYLPEPSHAASELLSKLLLSQSDVYAHVSRILSNTSKQLERMW